MLEVIWIKPEGLRRRNIKRVHIEMWPHALENDKILSRDTL